MSRTRLLKLDHFETDTLNLEKGEFAKFADVETKSVEIRVLAGVLWLTSEGRPEDVVLVAGDCLRTAGLKRILIEAMTDAVVLWSALGESNEIKTERSDIPSERSPSNGGFRAAFSPSIDSPYDHRVAPRASQRGRKDERICNH